MSSGAAHLHLSCQGTLELAQLLGEGGIRKEESSRSLPSQKPPPSRKRKCEMKS